MLTTYLQKLAQLQPLTETETAAIFEALVSNTAENPSSAQVTEAEIGAYLFATGSRLVTSDELVGAAKTLRKHMRAVDIGKVLPGDSCLDTCGTGGSGIHAFNTSTATALVVSASGQPVAKHGNKGATSKCGSADVLQALKVNLEPSEDTLLRSLQETNFCFLFAPNFHPATKRVAGIRRQLGFRTIFNFLGPLVNPARVCYQLLGVSNRQMLPVMAEALLRLGTKRALVVCGNDGLDELTLNGESFITELEDGVIRSYTVSAEQFDLKHADIRKLPAMDAQKSAEELLGVLGGENGIYTDLVLLNAGAALYICGHSTSIADGVALAREILRSKKALGVLQRVVEISNEP